MSDDPQFMGSIGRTYTLAIYLSNGQEYLSKPETIPGASPIDSLSSIKGYSAGLTNILPPPLVVTVHTRDPGNGPHYYKWSAIGYYPRKSWGLLVIPSQTHPALIRLCVLAVPYANKQIRRSVR